MDQKCFWCQWKSEWEYILFRSKSLKLKRQEPRPTLILNRWVLDGWVARYEWANTRIQSGRECQEFWRDCYWHQQCTNGFFTFWHFKDPWDVTKSGLTIHGIHKDILYKYILIHMLFWSWINTNIVATLLLCNFPKLMSSLSCLLAGYWQDSQFSSHPSDWSSC